MWGDPLGPAGGHGEAVGESFQAWAKKGWGQAGRCLNVTPLFWLQSRFMELMQEKVDLKEMVEELEHRFI